MIVADVSRPSWITNSAHKKREAADARLIAAAPELFEALQNLLELFDRHDDCKDLDVTVDARKNARDAIAKALGEYA